MKYKTTWRVHKYLFVH